jgi:hypothetical protein
MKKNYLEELLETYIFPLLDIMIGLLVWKWELLRQDIIKLKIP